MMQLLHTLDSLLALGAFILLCAARAVSLVLSQAKVVTHRNGRYWERLEDAYARYEATAQ
jgi:hypothetical protein